MFHAKYLSIARVAVGSQFRYLKPVLISRVFLVVMLLILYSLYNVLFKGGGHFGGFTLATLFCYLGITNALSSSKPGVFSSISGEIKDGSCAYNLLRPVHYISYHYFNCMGPALVNFFISLVIGLATFGLLAGFEPGIYLNILLVLPLLLLALSLHFAVSLVIGLLAFFMEETAPINWVYGRAQFLLGGAFIPLDLFPDWLRSAVQYLPPAYASYYPAKCAVSFDGYFYAKILVVQCAYLLALGALAAFLFRKGIRQVQINGG